MTILNSRRYCEQSPEQWVKLEIWRGNSGQVLQQQNYWREVQHYQIAHLMLNLPKEEGGGKKEGGVGGAMEEGGGGACSMFRTPEEIQLDYYNQIG